MRSVSSSSADVEKGWLLISSLAVGLVGVLGINERWVDPDGLSVWVGCAKFGMIFFSLEMGFI